MDIVKWVAERLSERTTWLGIAGIVGVSLNLAGEELEALGNVVVAVAGAVLVFGKNKWFNKAKAD